MKPVIRGFVLGLVLCCATSVYSDSVSIDLGLVNIENGITHNPEHIHSQTIRAQMGGVNCRRNAVPVGDLLGGYSPRPDLYFLFSVSDDFALNGNKPVLYVTIEYFDTGTGSLDLEYDSCADTSNPPTSCETTGDIWKVGGSVPLTDTNTWKWHTFHLSDAYFGNRENEGADFRFRRETGTQAYFYLNRVIVDDDVLPDCGSRVLPADAQTVTAVRGQVATPASLNYAVQNIGRQNGLTWQAQETDATGATPTDYPWLSIVPPPSGGPLDLMQVTVATVQIDSTDLPQGTHTAYVTFTDSCDPASIHVRQIDLAVLECGLEVLPGGDTYRSSSIIRSEPSPQPVVYRIRNSGVAAVSWTVAVSPGAAWLQLDKSGGELSADQQDAVTGTIDASGLAAGVHTATLQFADSCSPPNQHSRQVVLSVLDPLCVHQQFNGEFQAFTNKNLAAQSPLIRYAEGDAVGVFKTSNMAENPTARGFTGDWLFQASIEDEPTTVKFSYDTIIWAREEFLALLPFNDLFEPAVGIAAAWRLKVGNYVMDRAPVQIMIPTQPGSPGGGYPLAVNEHTFSLRINEGRVVGILTADGIVFPGLQELELAESVADGQFHTWAATGCFDAVFDLNYAYWNLWLDGQKLLFGGTEGTVAGPGGAIFSFRTGRGGYISKKPYVCLGELGRRGPGVRWDFEFDWVRVASLNIPGWPYWGGEGLASLWPDADGDHDVDQADFAVFQACATVVEPYPAGPLYEQRCERFDRDGDWDIDMEDYTAFSDCGTGPGIPLNPAALPAGCVLY